MEFRTAYALVVGVGTYAYPHYTNIPKTSEEAQHLGRVLCDPTYCGYPNEHITILHDAEATRKTVLQALDSLVEQITEDDTLFVYYSGHGKVCGDTTYYLTTHDTQEDAQRAILSTTAVRAEELIERLRALRSRRVLMLLNACHAGNLSPVLDASQPSSSDYSEANPPKDVAAALLATGEGRIIITACRNHQYSFVGGGDSTIFGQAVINGLQGKGTVGGKGYISAFDLYLSIFDGVKEAVTQIPFAQRQRFAGGVQEPEITILKGVGDFPVALFQENSASSAPDQAQALPATTAPRIVEPIHAERLLAQLLVQQTQTGVINNAPAQNKRHITQVEYDASSHTGTDNRYRSEVHGDQWNFPNATIHITPSTSFAAPPSHQTEMSTNGSIHSAVRKTNPFGRIGKITDPTELFGREELLRQCIEELNKGSNLLLEGESQVGKSSILSVLEKVAITQIAHPVRGIHYLDLQMLHDEDDFFEALCDKLQLATCRGHKLTRQLNGKRYILCLDEVEKLAQPNFSINIRQYLRGLADGPNEPLQLIVASRTPLDTLFPDVRGYTSPFHNIFLPLTVPTFSPQLVRSFITQRLQGSGVVLPDSAIDDLIRQSRGVPGTVQRLAAVLFDSYSAQQQNETESR